MGKSYDERKNRPEVSAKFTCDKTVNVRMNVISRSLNITTVAVEKQ
jgi:hypothetical protein